MIGTGMRLFPYKGRDLQPEKRQLRENIRDVYKVLSAKERTDRK